LVARCANHATTRQGAPDRWFASKPSTSARASGRDGGALLDLADRPGRASAQGHRGPVSQASVGTPCQPPGTHRASASWLPVGERHLVHPKATPESGAVLKGGSSRNHPGGGARLNQKLPDLLRTSAPPPLWKRVLCVIGAVILFALGIVGWLIPVVTGIPFYVLGLVLLGMSSQRVRTWINHAERRLPIHWRRRLRTTLRRLPGWLTRSIELEPREP
jgi:hypothetical protein